MLSTNAACTSVLLYEKPEITAEECTKRMAFAEEQGTCVARPWITYLNAVID